MAVSYNRLWKLLVDRKMSKADLRKQAEIAPNTMTKLRRDEEVTLGVLACLDSVECLDDKVIGALGCGCTLVGEIAYLRGNYSEASSLITCSCSFDRSVKCKKVGL